MKTQKYSDIVSDELMKGAFIHDAHTGFKEDYSVLNCLLRIYNPKSVCEIGTNTGNGVNVIASALPEAKIFSLDLDYETMKKNSKQYPLDANGRDRVGSAAKFPYTQLRGDSMTFEFEKYPCEAYWIDAEHTYYNVRHETLAAVACKAKLIVWHDTDIPEVMQGIQDALKETKYKLTRVEGTRISYARK